MTEFYDITTGRITAFPSIINGRGGCIYPRDWEAARSAGLRILHRAEPCPEGYVRDGGPRYEWTDSDCTESYSLITVDEYEQRQAQHEAARIATLAQQYGEKVGTLVALLAIFGINLPTTQAEATPIIYAIAKQDATKMADALMVLVVYQELRNELTDADIYAISNILNIAE